eukprot:675897-Alexandrium_andersonii.AAC.1
MPGGSELQLLDSKRETRKRRIASPASGARVRADKFNTNPQYAFTAEWIGVAISRQLGSYPAERQDDEPSAEGPSATAPPTPCEPSTSERMKRNPTRYPFKDWCSHCVKGKGE